MTAENQIGPSEPNCSSAPGLALPCSASPTWPGTVTTACGAAVAIAVGYRALALIPQSVAALWRPDGNISHDPWAWAPFVCELLAVVAVAAPVSFGHVLDFARAVLQRVKRP